MRPLRHARPLLLAFLLVASSHRARAQMEERSPWLLGASAIGVLTSESSTPGNRTRTEAYLTQPVLMGEWNRGPLLGRATLNLEGLTLRRGELTLGAWGEGYVDRRHPHAYVHELLLGVGRSAAGSRASLFAGRGFVPFGSDDPMSRPMESYPVNHHLAQVLERAMVLGALRLGPAIVEAATFNGDEPRDPGTAPLWRRFGDSWSVRGTLLADAWFADRLRDLVGKTELTTSYAAVRSPEYREGRGMDQRKWHVGVRAENDDGVWTRYALAEWARTDDLDRGRTLYTFESLLGEASVCRRGVGLATRLERSERPEEERLLDPFRSARPATDLSILGVTRWTTLSVAFTAPGPAAAGAHLSPFVEVARVRVERASAAAFSPSNLYGADGMWRASVGVRLALGHQHRRMGRYGAAVPDTMVGEGSTADHHTHASQPVCFE